VRSSAADWDTSTSVAAGEAVVPGSPGNGRVHKPAMVRAAASGAAIVRCRRPGDASAAIGFARRANGASRTGGQFHTGLATQGPSGPGPGPARR